MQNGSYTVNCGSSHIFYDSGGSGGNYSSNENYQITFCPSTPGTYIQLEFTSWDVEGEPWDFITIYNGTGTGGTVIGTFGVTSPVIGGGCSTLTNYIASSAASGCITITFESDGLFSYGGWSANITCTTNAGGDPITGGSTPPANAVCSGANPFCADAGPLEFPNTSDTDCVADAPAVVVSNTCLGSAPNPSWYFLEVDTAGDINLTIEQTTGPGGTGTGLDVDYAIWGPFSNAAAACADFTLGSCTSDHNCTGNVVDCSYSIAAVETVTITNAQVGEIYMVLITNFNGDPGYITMTQTNAGNAGAGSTDCSIVCPTATGTDPSCGASDGYIVISGLDPSTAYTVDYLDDGTPVSVNLTSNAAGEITISGLNAGNYTNIVTDYPGCETAFSNVTLAGGVVPVLNNITNNSPICEGDTAEFYFDGTPNATVTYDYGGASQTVVLDASGNATVTYASATPPNVTLNATLITSAGTPVVGNGLNASGGNTPANSTGVISASGAAASAANCASVNNTNTTLTITLEHTVPAGTPITISIARDTNAGAVTITGGGASINFNAAPNDVLQYITLVTVAATNTITITRTGGIVWVDGVRYNFVTSGCASSLVLSNTVVISPLNTIAAGINRTTCINSAITSITLATTGATGATITGLPAGVTGSWSGNVFTISGTPTASGTFNYTVTTTGGCPPASTTGTITVTPLNTIAAGINRTTCINSAITSITLATTGATGATVAGLPAGVTGSWSGNVFTISGTPTASGTFNYTVTTTGGCPPASTTGTITVTPLNTIAAGINRTTCINSAITSITLATTSATGATIAGLPAGVTGSWSGNVFTISGTPTASGIFNYTVTTTGGCPPASTTGTITVNPILSPIITCGTSTTTSVQFNWGAVSGATGYNVSYQINASPVVNIGAIGNVLTYSVVGLSPGDNVVITLTPTGGVGTCFTFSTQTCTASACVPPTLTLNSVAGSDSQTICRNSGLTPIVYTLSPGTPSATNVSLTAGSFPTGVTGSFVAGTYTISGIPTVTGTFNYTLSTTGGCTVASTTGTITVTPLNTIAAGTSQTVCINSAITSITLATTGATGATVAGLPAGVTGSWSGNVFTISGTPTASGIFNYTVTTTGGCPPASTTGTITVTPLNTIAVGTSQTVCINSAITSITLATTGATGATITGLPAGVTGSWSGNVFTISGTPTASGTFNYTVTTTGGCPPASTTGTITVTPLNTIAAGTSQTVCINSAITSITLATTGATGATVAGLPAGVTGSWSGNVFTISGTPTASGTFNYTVTTTGGCPPASTTGTITVTPLNTIAAGTSQTVCINSAITSITLATTGATGATVAGLPAGVTGSWSGNVFTISGTPTASGIFNYTVTTTGGCPPASTTGTITVTPLNTIAVGTSQTVCINSAITSITLATTGATGATITGLPEEQAKRFVSIQLSQVLL